MNIANLYKKLFAVYREQHWWPAKTEYEVVVGALLTQNTSWSNVEKAIARFDSALTPEFVLNCDTDKLAEIIKPAGYYNVKAKRLKELTEWYITADRTKPLIELRQELLDLKGIGCETADSILLYAFNMPVFVIDAYTKRLFTRLGFTVPQDYGEFKKLIEENIPKDIKIYNEFHALIVKHSKTVCKKSNPLCKECCLKKSCPNKV